MLPFAGQYNPTPPGDLDRMKTRFRLITPIWIIAITVIVSGCTVWNARKWESLENRSFHFQKFVYYLKGTDRRTAFEFMRDFPLDDVLRVVAEKHSIEIDTSEFRSFMEVPDNERRLTVFGVILSERFTWESKTVQENTVEFEYANEFAEDSTDTLRRYSLVIKTDGKVRAVYGDTVDTRDDVASSLSKLARRR